MIKRKNKNFIWVVDEVYKQDFFVVFASSHSKFRQIVKDELNIELEESEATGQFHGLSCPHKHQSIAIIWSSDKSNNLVHEILHATSWVMRQRDIHLDSESSEESYCYYLSYLYRTIRERMKWISQSATSQNNS